MPLPSRIVICAAGGGKTTRLVYDALAEAGSRSALIKYTRNNARQIRQNLSDHCSIIPSQIEVITWFTFLLRELARPYRRILHNKRIDGICWEPGRSAPFVKKSNTSAHYFANGSFIYSDKIAEFICECDRLSNGAPIRRLAQRFDRIFIDEAQDLAGYDLDLLELILNAKIRLILVGDHRQATFSTNNAKRNSAFSGINIIKKFRQWEKQGLVELSYQQQTYRCNQHIADLGDSFFPNEPTTRSLCDSVTDHDGVFTVPTPRIVEYMRRFDPQVLRLDKKTYCHGLPAMNFGESKGLTFDRVLVIPHVLGKKWLATGDIKHVKGSLAKMYVGATRARHSLAFVYDGIASIPHVRPYI